MTPRSPRPRLAVLCMRILALRTEGLVLPSIFDSAVRGFRSLDAEVTTLPVPRDEQGLLSFSRLIRAGFDAAFTLDMGGNPWFISRLRELQSSIRIPWIIWFVDDPEGYRFPSACDPAWTLAFCWDLAICQTFSPLCFRVGIPLRHMPLAADPEIFFPEGEKPGLPRFPGGVFVGSSVHRNEFLDEAAGTAGFLEEFDSLRDFLSKGEKDPQALAWIYLSGKTGRKIQAIRSDPICRLWVHTAMHHLGFRKRRDFVCRLIGPDGGVYGDPGWAHSAGERYLGCVNYGPEVRRIYNQSAFVLEIRQPQARTGLTQRVFDAAACGRPVLAEYSPELEILFNMEDDLPSFRGEEEGLEIKRRMLAAPGEASARAARFRIRILAEHTYRHRAAEMLRLASRF